MVTDAYSYSSSSSSSDGPVDGTPAVRHFGVDALWGYATGGADVAARPDGARVVVLGPRPAGVEEAAEWFQRILADPDSGQAMLFLVGGPGGGKSDVAAHLVSGLERLDHQDDDLAHRKYRFGTPTGRGVVLVNDATIPADLNDGRGSLADDIDALGANHLVACVNRGVLVDERTREDDQSLGSLVTSWLRESSGITEHANGTARLEPLNGGCDYLRQAELHSREGVARLVAVFVDACSLLEARPTVENTSQGLLASAYEIAQFAPAVDRTKTPAGVFLDQVLQCIEYRGLAATDPIAANLWSMSAAGPRNGVLSVLRAAELHSAQRMSYRQLWGAVCRMVAGHLPEQLNVQDLPVWLERWHPNKKDTARERFEAYQELASIRLHQALFDDPGSSEARHPLLRIMRAVDPARDLRPGGTSVDMAGWATPLFHAFSSAGMGASPLAGLIAEADNDALRGYANDFDRGVDAAFGEALQEVEDIPWRTDAIAWYGLYLSRMLAVATGHPAFGNEIAAWTEAWRMSSTVPSGLTAPLHALIAPQRDPNERDSVSQVPLYASRAMALVGRPARPTLVVRLPHMDLRTRKEGEDLFLEVVHNERKVGEILLDLPLVREALVTGGGWLGLTDATESTVPRLERFRAVNVLPRTREAGHVQLVTQHQDFDVTIPEGNQ